MQGYWNSPEATAFALRDGWLHTGDIGHADADGWLFVVDRIKDLIIRAGFNVNPRDVEDVLLAHPDVVAAAVVGRPDVRYGEEIVAFVQLAPGNLDGGGSDRLLEAASGHLPAGSAGHRRDPVDQRHEDRPQAAEVHHRRRLSAGAPLIGCASSVCPSSSSTAGALVVTSTESWWLGRAA